MFKRKSQIWKAPQQLGYDSGSLVWVFANTLKVLDIPFTNKMVNDLLSHHPSAPALRSLIECFPLWGVRAEAIHLQLDKLLDLPAPSLMQVKNLNAPFVILIEINQKSVTYLEYGTGFQTCSVEAFKNYFNGIVILLHRDTDAKELNYKNNLRKQRRDSWMPRIAKGLVLTAFMMLMIYGLYQSDFESNWAMLAALKSLGCIVSIVLLIASVNPDYLKKTCKIGEKVNCAKVLNSPASKIWGTPLCDICFVYFSAGLFSLCIVPTQGLASVFLFLALLNLFSLAYSIFSLYYQAFKIKQWCTLCLAVIVILCLEGVFFTVNHYFINATLMNAYSLIVPISLALGSGIVLLIRWVATKYHEVLLDKVSYEQFVYHRKMVEPLIQSAQRVAPLPEGVGLAYNQIESPAQIIIVAGIDCLVCATEMIQMKEFLNFYSDKCNINLVIAEGHHKKNNNIATEVLALYLNNKSTEAWQRLFEWYELLVQNPYYEYADWQKRHPELASLKDKKQEYFEVAKKQFESQQQWLLNSNIHNTPTLIVNQAILPPVINIYNLSFFMSMIVSASQ